MNRPRRQQIFVGTVLNHVLMHDKPLAIFWTQEICQSPVDDFATHDSANRLGNVVSRKHSSRPARPDSNSHLERVLTTLEVKVIRIVIPEHDLIAMDRTPGESIRIVILLAYRSSAISINRRSPKVHLHPGFSEPDRFEQVPTQFNKPLRPLHNSSHLSREVFLLLTAIVLRLHVPLEQGNGPLSSLETLHNRTVLPHHAGVLRTVPHRDICVSVRAGWRCRQTHVSRDVRYRKELDPTGSVACQVDSSSVDGSRLDHVSRLCECKKTAKQPFRESRGLGSSVAARSAWILSRGWRL